MPASVRVYLIINGRGDCRLTKRRPSLDWDEVAFPITVNVPQGWGYVYDSAGLELTLPAAPALAPPRVGVMEMPNGVTDDE